MSKVCKYGCGVELGQFNTNQNKFLEADNSTLHTKQRCESLKQKKTVDDWANQKQDTNGYSNSDISLELVLAKLRKIGVDINLDLLKNVPVNGNGK